MSADVSDYFAGCEAAKKSLAELRTGPDDLRVFLGGLFDDLEALVRRQLDRETTEHQARRQAECEALQGQIDRLASLTAELTAAWAAQKHDCPVKNDCDDAAT